MAAPLPLRRIADRLSLRNQPRPVWRRRLTVATAALSGTLALAGWTFASTVPYPIIARTLGLRELSVVKTERPLVGLVLATPERETRQLAVLLARRHVHASFADTATPSAQTLGALTRLGDETLPTLKSEQTTRLLSARQRLLREARRLELRGHFYFLAPHHFSLAEYIATRSIGGRPVEGAIRLRAAQPAPMDDELRAGAIIIVSVDPPHAQRSNESSPSFSGAGCSRSRSPSCSPPPAAAFTRAPLEGAPIARLRAPWRDAGHRYLGRV